jgi:hypothetical protein
MTPSLAPRSHGKIVPADAIYRHVYGKTSDLAQRPCPAQGPMRDRCASTEVEFKEHLVKCSEDCLIDMFCTGSHIPRQSVNADGMTRPQSLTPW